MSVETTSLSTLDFREYTILIVDDDSSNLAVLSDYLTSYGFQIVVARSGESALERVKYAPPDIILLDVMLPGIDGFEMCRRLKADENTQNIPALFMTVLTSTEDKVKGFEAGGVDYISKPLIHKEVLARVATHLNIRTLARELQKAHAELEIRVEERTAELARTNKALQAEITERVRAEEGQRKALAEALQATRALRESEARYRQLFNSAPDSVAVVDVKGVIIECSQSGTLLYGYPREEMNGKHITELMHPSSVATFRKKFPQLEQLEPIEGEIQIVKSDGNIVEIWRKGVPLTDVDGDFAGVLIHDRDITARKRAEETLRESEQQYRIIMEVSLQGTAQVDAKGRITFANPATAELTGYSLAELDGLSLDTLFPPGEAKAVSDANVALLYSGKPIVGENTLTRKDGSRIETYFSCAPVLDESGEYAGFVASVLDITARKRVEAEREILIGALEAKNAELERFTYTVSHDLKSPLITIRGFLGFVEQAAIAGNVEQMQADMARISNAAEKMQRLLDELLELSRIGRLMDSPEEVPLGELVDEAVEMVRGRLEERSVEVEIALNLPPVYGDRSRLREALENLIANAVKYMGDQPNPRIEIGMRRDDEEAIFYVRDNGIGIEPRYHEKVFGLFEKLDPGAEGSGVGLAIVKRIVEVHGGRIWVESESEGQGSTFCFTLPEHKT